MAARQQRLANLAACWLPALLLVICGWLRRWLADDAFIGLRAVRNILEGHGPIYNLGQRVEVFTGPLWMALLAACGALLPRSWLEAGGLEWLCVVLGLGCSFLGLLAATAASIRLQRSAGRTGPFFPVASLAIALFPPIWDFSTSGLESALVFGWLGVCFWLLVGSLPSVAPQRPARSFLVAVALGLGPLIRPELAIFSGCWFLALIATRSALRLRTALALAAAAGVIPLGYQLFRLGYYAAWVSNTAIAKEASAAYWQQGWVYAADTIFTHRLELPLAALLAGLGLMLVRHARRRDRDTLAVLSATVVGALVLALFVVRVGGDFMHARMLLPVFFALAMPLAAVEGNWGLRAAALVALWMLVTSPLGTELPTDRGLISDERRSYRGYAQHPNPVTLADYLLTPPFAALDRPGVVIDQQRASTYGGPYKRFENALDVKSMRMMAESGLTFYSQTPLGPDTHRTLEPWNPTKVIAPRFNIGMVGYAVGSDVSIVDVAGGVGDPITSRIRLDARERPGHEKVAPAPWVKARYLAPPEVDGLPPEGERTAAARRAYRCGDLAELRAAIESPLTLARFLRNVRVAGRLTALRFDLDPLIAERELCGSGD